jgi:hypothetical protein
MEGPQPQVLIGGRQQQNLLLFDENLQTQEITRAHSRNGTANGAPPMMI